MNADHSQADTSVAFVTGGTTTFIYSAGTTTWNPTASSNYYAYMIMPRSLNAKITAISGTTFTLDTNASTTTTNANVYYDNTPIASTINTWADNQSLTVAAGNFAFSERFLIAHKTNWTITGAGDTTVLFSPKGAYSFYWRMEYCTGCTVQNLTLRGNFKFSGFNSCWADPSGFAFPMPPLNYPQLQDDATRNLNFVQCDTCIGQNIKSIDGEMACLAMHSTKGSWFYDCQCIMTDGVQAYRQWRIDLYTSPVKGSGDPQCGAKRCTVTSPYLCGGCETFNADNVLFENISMTNATYSCNGSTNAVFKNCSTTVNTGSQLNSNFVISNPLFDLSTAIALGGSGVQIINPTMIHQGYINATNDVLIGIQIAASYDGVQITGTYPNCSGTGLYQAPDWASPGNTDLGVGVANNGTNTLVSGIRFTNHNAYASGSANIVNNAGTITATNCVMDHAVKAGSGSVTISESGTISNTTFVAGCPSHIHYVTLQVGT